MTESDVPAPSARATTEPAPTHLPWRRLLLTAAAYLVGWAVVAVPTAYLLFVNSERSSVLAGHDVVVSPTTDGWATIDLGAFLPDVRYPSGHTVGVTIDVGATNLDSYNALIRRYAVLASSPDGEIGKVTNLLEDMAVDAALHAAVIGLAGPALWLLIGRRRRTELVHRLSWRSGAVTVAVGAVVVAGLVVDPLDLQPGHASVAGSAEWEPLAQLLPETEIDGPAARLQVQAGLITSGTQRLLQSAFDTYSKSLVFYRDAAARAADLAGSLHSPADDETVALFVTDRHDNVGMDRVSRAIGDAGGATVLLDGGDDTSTGEQWEAFSLDSLATTFDDYDARYAVAGNHDNGPFVSQYLSDNDFTVLTGEPVEGVDGIRILGAPDPRSSGLGSWRTVPGISFDDQAKAVADTACDEDEAGRRIALLLVHDADLGADALKRGCVDLVIAGHLHLQVGPTEVVAGDGSIGTTYTAGTAGGAAYAFALGSKLRRDAEVTLVTFRDGKAVGLQPVTIRTNGDFEVSAYLPLRSDDGSALNDPLGD